MIHLAPCGPDPATIGTDAVSACASSSCDVVVVVVVVLESFFSIFFLRCSHTFVLLSRLLFHSLAHSLTHLYVSHTVIAVAFVVVVVLTSVCSYYLRCANSLAISFVFVRLFFALPIRYSLLVLSFAHGICFCMTLASAFAASFYVLKKRPNLLQLCRTRRRRRQLLAQRRRRQDETMTETATDSKRRKRKTSTRNKRKALPLQKQQIAIPYYTHTRVHTIKR